jgi:GGDEF domain-containing protein
MPRFGLDPIYTGQDDPSLVDIPTSAALRATASETFSTSPTPASYRADQVMDARDNSYRAYNPMASGGGYSPGRPLKSTRTPLAAEQVQAKIDAAGLTGHLKPAGGDTEESISLLIDYKTRELRNQFLTGRYQGGVAGGAAQLGTALVTSLADPLNIASAFVPVVGEARYAQILHRAGTSLTARAGVRAGVGALEGTVGSSLVEPAIYLSQQQLQADYDVYDSLANVGFGAVFGGVLQPTAGGVADVFARRAKVGAWSETLTPDGQREVPKLPEGFVAGGGTRFIEGDDYVKGAYALVDAAQLKRPEGEAFAALDDTQLGESPYADSGAPILNPDGSLATGKRRLASVLDVYARGEGDAYRTQLQQDAARYGLDSAQVEAMASPVLVRVQTAREPGRWASERTLLENTPQARAAFADPDTVVAGQFRRRARELGVDEQVAEQLTPSAPRDSVTGFYDGRTDDAKLALMERAQKHVADTGEPAAYVSADISNLGGLNDSVGNRAEVANVHYRALAQIMDAELRQIGMDVVPMRTGGDELGAVVIGADRLAAQSAFDRITAQIADYTQRNGLDNLPNKKRPEDLGIGLHLGASDIPAKGIPKDIFDSADLGVNQSKQLGVRHVTRTALEATGAGSSGRQSGGAGGSGGQAEGGAGSKAVRPDDAARHKTILSGGIAQAVNGEHVNPLAASKLDGTEAGIRRFLEERRLAEEAEAAFRNRTDADARRMVEELARFDPVDAEKLDAEVKALEKSLRDEVKATGGDESAINAALAEADELAEALDVESKALRGASLCLLRGG